MSNLEIWEKHADIDPKFTKEIQGKPYKGTSPNPQYVIKCLTEMFGPVGNGFGWEVVKEEFQPLGDETLHWCRIRFWHTTRENWFESYGQTKAIMKTRSGIIVDEDAPKKSLTDAIVKAASHVGVAANIFLGRWDDQKYVSELREEFSGKESKPTQDSGNSQKPESQNQTGGDKKNDHPSYAHMKRQLAELDKDLADCMSAASVDKCAAIWKAIVLDEKWTKEYVEAAKRKFDDRRQELAGADRFPGDE